jgi:hypothetical protein
MSLDSAHLELRSEPHAVHTDTIPIGEAPESVNHELIFRQISPLAEPATQSMTPSSYEKSGCTLMPNSNDAASNEMLLERVLSLLVVGASMLGGSAVLLMRALPPILHEFP